VTVAGSLSGTKLACLSRRDSIRTTNEVFVQAERAAREAETWADLSNFLFNPIDGLVTRAYPTREAREAFVKTDEYKKVRELVSAAIERHGLVEGATPRTGGRFVVRLPRSLHAALEREAAAEGVSLNQLVIAKPAVGLGRLTRLAHEPQTDTWQETSATK
jgi:hypothetical protein